FIRLAEDLAVRDVPGASSILDRQFERTKNPDRKAQFAFVRPSLAGDPREREAWFASLADVANRRREPWVLEGLRYLHHPLRAGASEKYIEPSLVLLREALDGQHTRQLPVGLRRRRRARVPRPPAARVSGAPAAHHPVVGRRPV